MSTRLLAQAVASALLILFLGSAGTTAVAQTLADLAKVAKTAETGGAALFGSKEFKANTFKGLPQWSRVLHKMTQQHDQFLKCTADAAACRSDAQRTWRDVVRRAASLGRRERLKLVNQAFNKIPYRLDREVYGVGEYWATPEEFLGRSGDCEDYAIAKFFALRQLGFDPAAMRVVILWDEIRRIGHAVLAVYEGQEILILDNLSGFIVSHAKYKHYIPQYSMNDTSRWAHVHKKKIPTLLAHQS